MVNIEIKETHFCRSTLRVAISYPENLVILVQTNTIYSKLLN